LPRFGIWQGKAKGIVDQQLARAVHLAKNSHQIFQGLVRQSAFDFVYAMIGWAGHSKSRMVNGKW